MLKETAQVERHGAMVSAPDLRLYVQDCRLTPSPTSCFNNPSRQCSINGCQLNEQSAVTQNSYENLHQLNQKNTKSVIDMTGTITTVCSMLCK